MRNQPVNYLVPTVLEQTSLRMTFTRAYCATISYSSAQKSMTTWRT